MGKVSLTIGKEPAPKLESKEVLIKEIIVEKPVEVTKEIIVQQACQCKCEKSKPDYKLRKYAVGVRKEMLDLLRDESLSIRELQSERIGELAQSIDALDANLNGMSYKSDIAGLEKELSKIKHNIDLIEQDLKVKPLNIKTEKVIERFDHRLLIFNLILVFLNIIFLLK